MSNTETLNRYDGPTPWRYEGPNNVTTHFETRGAPANPPVLFLHGGGIHPGPYAPFLNDLANVARLIVADLPGHRHSSPAPKDWHSVDLGNHFAALLEHFDYTDVTVVGHSFGGLVALYTALQSERVKQAVVFDSGGWGVRYSKWELVYRVMVVKNACARIMYAMGKEYAQMDKANWDNIVLQPKTAWQTISLMYQCLQDPANSLEQLHKPVTLVWGDGDEIFPLIYAYGLKNTLPAAQLEIWPDHNHDAVMASPERAAEVVKSQLRF